MRCARCSARDRGRSPARPGSCVSANACSSSTSGPVPAVTSPNRASRAQARVHTRVIGCVDARLETSSLTDPQNSPIRIDRQPRRLHPILAIGLFVELPATTESERRLSTSPDRDRAVRKVPASDTRATLLFTWRRHSPAVRRCAAARCLVRTSGQASSPARARRDHNSGERVSDPVLCRDRGSLS